MLPSSYIEADKNFFCRPKRDHTPTKKKLFPYRRDTYPALTNKEQTAIIVICSSVTPPLPLLFLFRIVTTGHYQYIVRFFFPKHENKIGLFVIYAVWKRGGKGDRDWGLVNPAVLMVLEKKKKCFWSTSKVTKLIACPWFFVFFREYGVCFGATKKHFGISEMQCPTQPLKWVYIEE